MSFFWKRSARGRTAIALSGRGSAQRPIVALALTLLSTFLLAAACSPTLNNPSALPASTSPLSAANVTPAAIVPSIEGEPAISESVGGEPSAGVVGEPEIATGPPDVSAEDATTTPTALISSTAKTISNTAATVTADFSTTAVATATPTPTATATIDLSALLAQPVAPDVPATAMDDARAGALSGATATLTPTAASSGAIMARLAAMNSAATATADAAATSAPVDAQMTDDSAAMPEMQPAPALAPPATPATNSGTELVWDGTERTLNVPILMYHYLSEPPVGADAIRRDLSVSPQRFAAHLDRLQEEGYTTISLYTLMAALATGAPLPEKPVVLTFDDGYRDNYENAFPLLRERNMTATFFVVTDFIDEERDAYVSWDMVREMLAGGMSIESHGRNHATLEGRNDDYLVWQALGSLETLQFELGERPRFVSYPAGDYDANTKRIFASAGYWAGVTTEPGATETTADPFALPRVRIHSTTTADQLSVLLTMDWE